LSQATAAARKPAPVVRLAAAKPAKAAQPRPARRQAVGRGAVAAQQARAQGFALDLSQGGPDLDDKDFTDY
jgi:methyl-accepting chemotaxis protein